MKKVKIHLLLSLSFGLLMLAATQVSAATVGEYCQRTTSPEAGEAGVQSCIQDFGGNPNRDLGPDYDPPPEDDSEDETIDYDSETVGEYCRRTSLPELGDAEVQSCIQDFGGNANVLVINRRDQVRLPLNQNGNSGIAIGGNRGSSGGGNRDSSDGASNVPSAESPSYFDHSVTVSGGAFYQPLTGAGIGHADIIAKGVISATNVWGTVPPGTVVCFVGLGGGGVMFKDSSITPHPLSWLDHYSIGSDTCVDLPGAGTVVLVEQGASYADAAPPADTLPSQSICQIKLVETLFLRAQPAGQIIGLVWLNSEVPVFAIDGHWYRVEFERQVGYISRYHRQVLAGAC